MQDMLVRLLDLPDVSKKEKELMENHDILNHAKETPPMVITENLPSTFHCKLTKKLFTKSIDTNRVVGELLPSHWFRLSPRPCIEGCPDKALWTRLRFFLPRKPAEPGILPDDPGMATVKFRHDMSSRQVARVL